MFHWPFISLPMSMTIFCILGGTFMLFLPYCVVFFKVNVAKPLHISGFKDLFCRHIQHFTTFAWMILCISYEHVGDSGVLQLGSGICFSLNHSCLPHLCRCWANLGTLPLQRSNCGLEMPSMVTSRGPSSSVAVSWLFESLQGATPPECLLLSL